MGRHRHLAIIEPVEPRTLLAAGAPDPTFGVDGYIRSDLPAVQPNPVSAVLVQPDGKVIAAGGAGAFWALTRLDASGNLDPAFGTGGIVTRRARFPIADAALQADGSIIVVAPYLDESSTVGGIAVGRYLADGTPDLAFGDGGVVILDLGGAPQDAALAVDAHGRIAAAADVAGTTTILRLNASGVPDDDFGDAGRLIFAGGPGHAVRDMLVAPDDDVLVLTRAAVLRVDDATGTFDGSFGAAGVSAALDGPIAPAAFVLDAAGRPVVAGASGGDSAFVRLTADGQYDFTFGPSARRLVNLASGNDGFVDVGITPGGRIVALAAVPASPSPWRQLAYVAYTPEWIPDNAFNDDGILLTDAGDGVTNAAALAVLPDGSAAAAATLSKAATRFSIQRLDATGHVDTTFGSFGRRMLQHRGFAPDRAAAAAMQPDGRVVVVGSCDGRPALARYNPDGTLDAAFADNGVFLVHKLGSQFISGRFLNVAIGKGGNILVLAQRGTRYLIYRFNRYGSLDSAFADQGRLNTFLSTQGDRASGDLWVHPSGRVVVAVSTPAGVTAARFNTDGTLDAKFGTRGRTTIPNAAVNDLLRDPAGNFLLGGRSGNRFFLARLLPGGALDGAFGTRGATTTPFGAVPAEVHQLALRPDGRILAAGTAGKFVLARYTARGLLDKPFGKNGKVATAVPGAPASIIGGLLVQPDGRVIVAAVARDDQTLLLRYTAAGAPDPSFAAGAILRLPMGIGGGADAIVAALPAAPDAFLLVGAHDDDWALARVLA